MAGKVVQAVIGSGAPCAGQCIGDYGHSKGCLKLRELSLQEVTGFLDTGIQVLGSHIKEPDGRKGVWELEERHPLRG